jgi:hypothetical protein
MSPPILIIFNYGFEKNCFFKDLYYLEKFVQPHQITPISEMGAISRMG